MIPQISKRFPFITVMLLVSFLLVSACGPAAPTQAPPTPTMGPVDLVKAYENAFNRHDVPGVMALLTEDASWSLPAGGMDAPTRQEVQKTHEYMSGLNPETHFNDCEATGDTVVCKQTTTEDCIRSSGINMIPGRAVFTIDQDKIKQIYLDWTSDELTQYWLHTDKFIAWFKETYPSEYTKIFGGEFPNNRETGTTLGGLCKEFAAAQENNP